MVSGKLGPIQGFLRYDRGLGHVRCARECTPEPKIADQFGQHLVNVTLGVTMELRCEMNWRELRQAHPDRWLVIEAIAAHSDADRRVIDAIALVASTDDAKQAMKQYLELHRKQPSRELYVAHTSREALDIEERRWAGIRRP